MDFLKINTDFFETEEISKFQNLVNGYRGHEYIIIYLKIKLLSAKSKGILKLEFGEDRIVEEISNKIKEREVDVKNTIEIMIKNNMMQKINKNEYLILGVEENIENKCMYYDMCKRCKDKERILI